jgi:hypothetical protein
MVAAAATQLPSPPPITDRIALGALTHSFPPVLVDEVVQQTGRAEQRRRLLPARVVVYFVLALALYSHAAYEEVMRCLVGGLGWAQQARRGRRSWPWWHVPGASALVEARTRLGPEPLKVLFERSGPRGRWRRRRRGGRGIAGGGCWCWTGPVWMCPIVPPTRCWAAPRAAVGRAWARSRRCGWWGWWRRARTRSWLPSRVPTLVGSRPWPASSLMIVARWGRECWCWPTGCCRRRAVAGHGRHRRGPGVASQVRQGRP